MKAKSKQKLNGRNKAPAFQFYAMDWLTDPSLRLCSPETRGVWIDLLCWMFLSNEPGFLIINGQPLDANSLKQFVNCDQKSFEKIWSELTKFGIIKLDDRGVYYSKRMVEDERIRQIRRDCGSLGGNPKLQPKREPKVKNLDKQDLNQNSTPSSSSSNIINNDKSLLNNKKENDDWFHPIASFVEMNCPNVQKLKKQLTLEQCFELDEMFGFEKTTETLSAMENFKSLGAKYVSVHLTALNWLKRAKNDNTTNNKQPGNRKPDFTDAISKF